MWRNYFKTAFRNLLKNKVTSFINLFGLSVGMTAAVLIFLWVQNEMTYDENQPGKENIYRITNAIAVSKDESWTWETSPMLMAETSLKEIPEIQKAARLMINSWGGMILSVDHKVFSEKTTAWVDKSLFSMFNYNFVAGNAAAFAKDPFTVILTESKAKKYFGGLNAIGQVIKLDTINYTVQGIVKDNPLNSSFQFDILLNLDGRLSDPRTFKNDKTWNNFGYITFLELRNDADKKLVATRLNDIIRKNRTNDNTTVSLTSLNDMYFESDLQSSDMPHGSKKTAYIFTLLGILMLVTACINYVNLTTAKASLRAKEVSVRKIIGAKRVHLFMQFIAESIVISLLSLLFALVMTRLALPLFNSITSREFLLPLNSFELWRVLLGTLLLAALLNGIYPAVLLSSFKPLNVFRGRSLLKLNDVSIRKGLVVFQFALSVVLIVGTLVIYNQLKYIQTSNPGYNIAQVMSVEIPYDRYSKLDENTRNGLFDNMRHDLEIQRCIAAVSGANDEIINVSSASSGNADWAGRDSAFNPTIAKLTADVAFQNMFSLQMAAGRWFSGKADEHNYIINETAAATFYMEKPLIGQQFIWGGDTGNVIGIVKDFHYKSMHEKIGPMVIGYTSGRPGYVFVKTVAGNIPQAISAVAGVYAKYFPDQPFEYNFLEDNFNKLYTTDVKTSQLFFVFAIIAIIISALGLFGLAAFTAEQRTKEIGIRKVLGASVQQIAGLLSKDFIKLVLIAIVIASPVAWWAMNKWLQDFAYRIDLTVWIFISAGALAVFIALLSVSVQAIKAAIANPVKSLRTE